MDTIKICKKNTHIIAHRGLSGVEKENTMPAFIAACNRSYFGVETDVHVTSDGKFVIIHNDTTGDVADRDLRVEESDFDTLRSLPLKDIDGSSGRCDLKIPTLSEYVNVCKRYGKKCILELKNKFSDGNIKKIIDIIDAEGYLDQIVFISFCLDNLIELRRLLPHNEIQYLFCKFSEEVFEAMKKYNLEADMLYYDISHELVERLHAEKIKINCWTCDNADHAKRLIECGVDYITTNILE